MHKIKDYNQAASIVDNMLKQLNKNDETANLVHAIKTYSKELYDHSYRVAIYSVVLSNRFADIDNIEVAQAGFLHDIGKTKIDKNILNKKDTLTDYEFAVIKKHVEFSYEILSNITELSESVKKGVFQHHERVDGCGYPLRLTEDKISSIGKIVGIADTFDAVTSKRPYRKKVFNTNEACQLLTYDTGYDQSIVDVLIEIVNA